MFYAELTKEFNNVFKLKDEEIIKQEILVNEENQNQEEEKKTQATSSTKPIETDPAKLAAQMLKK